MLFEAIGFADNAFDQIAFDIVAGGFFADNQAEAFKVRGFRCVVIHNKKRAVLPTAHFEEGVEVGFFK